MLPLLATLAQMGLPLITDAVVGMAKDKAESFIKDKTGVSLDLSGNKQPTEAEMAKLKEWHDNDLKKLAEQNRHAEEVMKNERETLAMYLNDVGNARDMQKEALKQEDLFSKRFIYYLAIFWSVVGAAYVFMITFYGVPQNSERFADTVLGFLLGTIVSTIINFFFGSSKGSADKTNLIATQISTSKDNGTLF